VLAGERGLLVDFRDAAGLAKLSLRILDDPDLKRRLEHNAYEYGRETAWPRIGERMLGVLREAVTPLAAWSIQPVTLASADAPVSSDAREPVKASRV
jgi:hypothetical protein